MATKKISELPLVNRVSGSQVAGGSVLPIVIGGGIQGTTNQISVEDFSLFVNAYNATTSSNTFIGTQNVTGDVNISGRLTVKEVVAQYETASILFSTGSTKLGDQLTDKHEFTGSTNITGSLTADGFITLNGQSLNNAFDRIHQATHSLQLATASLQFHSASVNAQLLAIQQTTQSLHVATASLQFHSASVNAQLERLQQTTQSLQVATASLQAFSSSVNDQLQRVYQTTQSLHVATASLEFHSASVDAQLLAIQQTTQSLHVATASLQAFSSSVNDQLQRVYQTTQSLQVATASLQAFTSSQLAVNLGNSIYTASVDSHIVGISTYTSSVRDTLARVHQATQSLQVATASLQQFTASQDSRNFVVSQVTGSLIGITNGLMAFTAALDNTYATDAQLYQLYQSTRSLELHSGSMVGVTNGLMAYTASNSTLNTGLRGEVDGIEAYTASLKGQAIVSSSTQVQNYDVFALNSNLYTSTGSLIGITNGLMAFTAALDSTYATDAQLFQLYQATRSIELTTGSLIGITNGLMAFTAALDSTYATDAQLYQLYAETASIKAEIAGIEAYTASLKGAAIVSSSQQITNYYKFAETASANTFYGDQTITGSLAINDSATNFLIEGNGFSQTYLTSNGAIVLNPGYGGIEMVGSYRTFKATDITADGFVSGEIRATNNVVSSSQQITNYYKFAETASANTFYGTQTISGSLNVTGSAFVSGNLGIGMNPVYKLDVSDAIRGLDIIAGGSTIPYDGTLRARTSANNTNVLLHSNGASYVNGGSFTVGAGDLTITNGNLVMGTSGKGIDFSATANSGSSTPSELLNDYEEGTWTPTVIGSGTAGTYTLSGVVAYYTKIGNQVTVFANFGFSAASGGSGYVTIGGLPFNYRTNNSALGTIMGINFDYSAGMLYAVIAATSSSSTNNIFIQEAQDNTTSTEGPIAGVTASTSFRFTYTYTVS